MSERELTKWKNKYKVWVALHPNWRWNDVCMGCRLSSNVHCGVMVTLSYDKKTDKIYNAVDVPKGAGCIEWIKDV